eukprot:gene7545-biopygen2561
MKPLIAFDLVPPQRDEVKCNQSKAAVGYYMSRHLLVLLGGAKEIALLGADCFVLPHGDQLKTGPLKYQLRTMRSAIVCVSCQQYSWKQQPPMRQYPNHQGWEKGTGQAVGAKVTLLRNVPPLPVKWVKPRERGVNGNHRFNM